MIGYPLKMIPLFKERIWGDQNLARLLGKNLAEGQQIGESWELADLAEGQSQVANGVWPRSSWARWFISTRGNCSAMPRCRRKAAFPCC